MLDSYLQRNIKQMGNFKFIHCPEIVTLYFDDEQTCQMVNERYKFVKQSRQRALVEKDYETYVFLAERPYRLGAFVEVLKNKDCPFEKLAKLLLDIWIDAESPSINKNIWMRLFRQFKNSKAFQTTKATLPETITVWRGGSPNGLSWTTSRDIAVKFAKRSYRTTNKIQCRHIHKSDAICFLEDRGESEIIILNG